MFVELFLGVNNICVLALFAPVFSFFCAWMDNYIKCYLLSLYTYHYIVMLYRYVAVSHLYLWYQLTYLTLYSFFINSPKLTIGLYFQSVYIFNSLNYIISKLMGLLDPIFFLLYLQIWNYPINANLHGII